METAILPILKEVLIVLLGLSIFIILKDRLTLGMSLKESVKSRGIQLLLNPLFIPGIVIVILIAIFYIAYTLVFN